MTEPKTLNLKAPWTSSYGELPAHLNYSEKSMSAAVLDTCEREKDFPALLFMGRKISYSELGVQIDKVARAYYNMGIRPGDRVMLCLPNVPQAIYSLYGLNLMGAIPTMVHPLSAVGEIVQYLKEVDCHYVVTLDQFYDKLMEVKQLTPIKKLVVTSISEELPCIKSIAYKLFSERKFAKVQENEEVVLWKNFICGAAKVTDGYKVDKDPMTEAVVLFSGGTTGVTKGIKLSDYGFNATALQTATMSHENVRHMNMLAAMPVFHGFGLGVCIHTMMYSGGTSILVPRFNPRSYAMLIKKNRPNFIAGVPTLFEAIARNDYLDGVDLSCLKGVFSGGDSLSVELKKKIDTFLAEHHATIRVREGYGTTECVTACCLTPWDKEKEGSIGIPYPDTYFRICDPGTDNEVPYGSEGEICLTGPGLMLGYINHDEENATTLLPDSEGITWLHTGDLGMMDEDGFVYFRQRIKRMIITSGYNVYPSQLENIIDAHPAVRMSCVIGVDDPYKIQKVKAFVVLNQGYEKSDALIADLMAYCRKRIARYAMPYEIEIRDSLPTTLVGKVSFNKLIEEEKSKAA